MICLNVSFRVPFHHPPSSVSASGGRKRIRREGLTGERERGLLYLVKSFVIPNYLPSTVDGENPTVGRYTKRGKRHTRFEDNHLKTSLLGFRSGGVRVLRRLEVENGGIRLSLFYAPWSHIARGWLTMLSALIIRAN